MVTIVLLLFRRGATGVCKIEAFSYAQHMDVSNVIFGAKRAPGCIFALWMSFDDVYRAFDIIKGRC